MENSSEQFVPFPAEKRQQMENRVKPGTVHNPHHPHVKAQQAASQPKVAAAGISLTTQGTVAPQGRPQMPQPMAAPIPEPQPYVHVTPNSEAEAVSFALPSNFLVYDQFKDLYIRPFKGRHFAKLHRAREEQSMLHMIEVVSSVISNAAYPTGLAFELTLPDYYACLYWLRMHSFLKHGFTHQTMCRSKVHHDWVNNGRPVDGKLVKVEPDTLKYATLITSATLKTKQLKVLPNPEEFALDYQGIKLVPILMKDVLEITMNENIDRFTARTAASIQLVDRNASLQERMQLVDDMSGDDIATIARYEKAISDYGVVESLKWTCKTCGHIHTDELEIEAHSFFPLAA
jgi:hypothetical protein